MFVKAFHIQNERVKNERILFNFFPDTKQKHHHHILAGDDVFKGKSEHSTDVYTISAFDIKE
jgi:hypothetical protein